MDHDRVNISSSQISCGVLELSRLSDDTDGLIFAIGSRLYHPSRGKPAAVIIFSDVYDGEETSSSRLANKVNDLHLGDVIVSPPVENSSTGNIIAVYVWTIDHVEFRKCYALLQKAKFDRVWGK